MLPAKFVDPAAGILKWKQNKEYNKCTFLHMFIFLPPSLEWLNVTFKVLGNIMDS